MVRTTKDPEIRRQELMDAALELFLERGTDGTAVSDIVRRVGVAQGTFYYHFKSKDEVVNALADSMAEPLGQMVAGIAEDESVSVAGRIGRAVASLLDVIGASQQHLEGLIRPGNEVLHQRVADAMQARLHPAFVALVGEGQADGSLDAEPVEETVELVLAAITHLTRTQAHGEGPEKLASLRTAVERLARRGLGISEED